MQGFAAALKIDSLYWCFDGSDLIVLLALLILPQRPRSYSERN
jgi:hypothetical protein